MQPSVWQRLHALWLFQRQTGGGEVEVTAGTIVYGALVRAFVIVVGTLSGAALWPELWRHWWLILFVLWGAVFYPAYRRWSDFTRQVRALREELLCGSCRYFDETGQLCTLLDEHVRPEYIPCGGEAWEARDQWEEELPGRP